MLGSVLCTRLKSIMRQNLPIILSGTSFYSPIMLKIIHESTYYSQITPKYVCQISIFVRVFKQVTALLELWTRS